MTRYRKDCQDTTKTSRYTKDLKVQQRPPQENLFSRKSWTYLWYRLLIWTFYHLLGIDAGSGVVYIFCVWFLSLLDVLSCKGFLIPSLLCPFVLFSTHPCPSFGPLCSFAQMEWACPWRVESSLTHVFWLIAQTTYEFQLWWFGVGVCFSWLMVCRCSLSLFVFVFCGGFGGLLFCVFSQVALSLSSFQSGLSDFGLFMLWAWDTCLFQK